MSFGSSYLLLVVKVLRNFLLYFSRKRPMTEHTILSICYLYNLLLFLSQLSEKQGFQVYV